MPLEIERKIREPKVGMNIECVVNGESDIVNPKGLLGDIK